MTNTTAPMHISLDLRFADFPGGGYAYASKLLPALVGLQRPVTWRVYANAHSPSQRQIIAAAEKVLGSADIPRQRLEVQPVSSACLTLRQHGEFRRFRDRGDLYHYLHFDMPVGMRGLPLVVTVHDLYPLSVPGYCSAAKRAYFFRLTRYNCRRAAQVIAISEYTKRELIERLDIAPDKIAVVPQSHAQTYHPIEDEQALGEVRRRYGLPARFILYTGNHKLHKNLPRLISAFARLPDAQRREFSLVLTGAVGAATEPARQKAAELNLGDEVRFVGWVDDADLPALYNMAALVVLPSLYEGFGLSSLEAMACGTAVACSNATAIPEVVGNLGRTFEPTDIEAMAAALRTALERDIDDVGQRAARIAHAARFSERRTALATFAVYEAAAGVAVSTPTNHELPLNPAAGYAD